MAEYAYNDGLCSGGRRPRLWLVKGQRAVKFTGSPVDGMVAIAGENFQKNGKWSNTTYRLLLAPGVRPLHFLSPLHGVWGESYPTWGELASDLGLPLDVAQAIVREEYPKTAQRLDEMDAFAASIDEDAPEPVELLLSWKDDQNPPCLKRGQEQYLFEGRSIPGVCQVIRDQSCRTGMRKYRNNAYWVALAPGVEISK